MEHRARHARNRQQRRPAAGGCWGSASGHWLAGPPAGCAVLVHLPHAACAHAPRPCQTYTASEDNVWVKRGELHITALRSEGGDSYTSGQIQSRDSWYPGVQVGGAAWAPPFGKR